MISNVKSGIISAKFEDGEGILECYEKLALRYKIKNAVVLSGIGMLKGAKMGYYRERNGKWGYEWKIFSKPVELVSTNGNIMADGSGKRTIHLHAAIAGRDHILCGGHIGGGNVWIKNEVFVKKLE